MNIIVFYICYILIFVFLTRWIFRINHIIQRLEQLIFHCQESVRQSKDMRKQNQILIQQQEEIIELIDTEISSDISDE
jgi:hypothetical protein